MAIPPSTPADRNLLFGILALQINFIDRDALVAALRAWVVDKPRPLGEILVHRGDPPETARPLLEALVEKHLELHGGEPHRSLSAAASLGTACEELRRVDDPDLHASLATLPPTLLPGQPS